MVAMRRCAMVQAQENSSPFTIRVLPFIGAASFRNWKAATVLVTKKCQAWFYLRLVAYSFFRLSEGHTVVVGTAARPR
jgi:hypothetical protein